MSRAEHHAFRRRRRRKARGKGIDERSLRSIGAAPLMSIEAIAELFEADWRDSSTRTARGSKSLLQAFGVHSTADSDEAAVRWAKSARSCGGRSRSGTAAAQLPLGYAIRELKPVGTVSAPDWTPTSSTADSIETSNGGDALKLSAKPASEASMGSAGTAKILNPSSDLREMPGGKPSAGVAATPKIAEETPSQPPKSAKRQKREKSATAPKLNAAEADASSLPATSEEPPVTRVPPIHCRAPTLGDYNAILKGSGFSRGARGPSRRSRKLALVG